MSTSSGRVLEKFIKISVVLFAILSIFFFPSLIKVIPFFQINHLSVNTNDARLHNLIKEIIRKNFSNNYLLLYLNRDKFENLLKDRTKYCIEKVISFNFNWKNGNLYIKIEENQPIALLNNKFLLAKNGRIFGFKTVIPSTQIYDRTSNWNYGEIYDNINLELVKNFKKIHVGMYTYTVENFKVRLILPKNSTDVRKVSKVLTLKGKFLEANLLGKKNVYVKIIKE